MQATVDSYSQMRILLSASDIESLGTGNQLVGRVWRTDSKEFELKVYLTGTDRAETRIVGRGRKASYRFGMQAEALDRIRKGKILDYMPPLVSFRQVCISREDRY